MTPEAEAARKQLRRMNCPTIGDLIHSADLQLAEARKAGLQPWRFACSPWTLSELQHFMWLDDPAPSAARGYQQLRLLGLPVVSDVRAPTWTVRLEV